VHLFTRNTTLNPLMNATDNGRQSGTWVDFIPQPILTDGGAGGDEAKDLVANDREEEHALARWLGAMCTTRSDIYTAYIVVRGYKRVTDSGGTERHEAMTEDRYIVTLDRSKSTSTNKGQVDILGVYQY